MAFIQPFTDLSKEDVAVAGGKGASLGEMIQAKIPVPPGFVILSSAFDRFISETNIKADIDSILHKVNHHEMESVERASEEIQALILSQKVSIDLQKEILSNFNKLNTPFVAVRSSATAEDSSSAAWAGQLDTFLNTTKEKLLENVKRCWASLFTPRAIFYRFEKGLHGEHISVAVVVQKMVESEVSGIAFSVHPVTQDYNQLIIEAGYGLGEAIVSGQITPDSYVLEKKPFGFLNKNVSEQKRGIFRLENGGNEWKEIDSEKGSLQKLDDTQIQELGKLVLKIEAHYGFPVDVEWALEKGIFYITQSRPITTLKEFSSAVKSGKMKAVVTRRYGILISDMFVSGLSRPKSFEQLMELNDFYLTTGVFTDKWCFGKEIHDLGQRLFDKEMTKQGSVLNVFDTIYSIGEELKLFSEKMKVTNFSSFSNDKLMDTFREFVKKYELFSIALAGWGLQGPVEMAIRERLKGSNDLDEELSILTFPTKKNFAALEQRNVLLIASELQKKKVEVTTVEKLPHNFSQKIRSHLDEFGWMNTRGGIDDPWTEAQFFERLKDLCQTDCGAKLRELDKFERESIRNSEALLRKLSADKVFSNLVSIAKELVYYRTYRTDYLSLAFANVRPLIEEIAKRKRLSWKEILAYRPDELLGNVILSNNEIELREKGFVIITVEPDKVIFETNPKKMIELEEEHLEKERLNLDELKGTTAYKGKIVGKVVLIQSKSDFQKVKEGAIIVTTMTTPDMAPVMQKAAAFITDEGGITCHAAVVAREMKKPCIIGTKVATQLLKNEMVVEVDADNGVIRIAKEKVKPYERVFSRDFSLSTIQLALTCESSPNKPWYLDTSPHKPHMVAERIDGTVHVYFNPNALGWMNNQLIQRTKKDASFLTKVEKKVLEGISYIRPIYEEEQTLDLPELKKFIDSFISVYSWVEAMWWLYRLTPEELGADNSNIKKIRVLTDKLSAGTDVVIRKSLKKIYPELGELSSMFTLEEIRKGVTPSKEELALRDAGYYQVDSDLLVGASREEIEEKYSIQLEQIEAVSGPEVKGETAHPGKVRGIVCRVMGHNDFGKIQEGQILVSPMTMPDFLQEMKKAAAFVTDEGGMMCHAAIVAREMKKPCIVGTKSGTATLNDGDEVEVDATSGLVRILEGGS
ncbi:MAG: PEP/pyruvate-binding domain-containing protein [Candidatus Diapherotrites archaeon]